MAQMSASLFAKIAHEVVPKLRHAVAEMGFPAGDVTPSIGMTATIEVDGEPARVRIQVTLDPDEEDGANDVYAGDPCDAEHE